MLAALYKTAADGLSTLTGSSYEGTGIGTRTPIKDPSGGQAPSIDNRTHDHLLRALRCLASAASPYSKSASPGIAQTSAVEARVLHDGLEHPDLVPQRGGSRTSLAASSEDAHGSTVCTHR